jgi:hypothetical protein
MHKKNIDHIIEHGTNEQMGKLKDVLVDAVIKLKEFSPKDYNNVEFCIHKIAHDGKLGEDLSKCWVEKMENKDGTKGPHWSWDQVAQVYKEKKIGDDLSELYAVLNMMYSDYYNPKFDTNTYIELAKDWIVDPDVGDCKTLKYYFFVVQE